MEQRRRGSWWANLRLWKPGPAAIILMALVFMAQVGFYSKIRLNQACTIQTGSGTPEGTVTGAVCDLYLRTNGGTGTTLYVKESGSGNTGWAPAGSGTGSGTVVRKTADESVTSSTTLQNDDHLTVAIGASQVMAIRYILFVDAGATGDLKLGLSVPASGTYRCGAGHVSNNVSSSFAVQATSTTSVSVGGLGAGTIYEYVLDCTVVNSTTPGNVVLQFAQDVSDGTATTLKTNSVAMAGSPSGGGGTTYSAGDGISLAGDVINLVLDGASLTKSGSGLKVTNPFVSPSAQNVNTSETQASNTAYGDLATSGPAVTLTTGTSAVVAISSGAIKGSGGNSAFVAVDVSGATTIAAADGNGVVISEYAASHNLSMARTFVITGLNAGSNTFTLKYKNDGGGTWTFFNRSIVVWP